MHEELDINLQTQGVFSQEALDKTCTLVSTVGSNDHTPNILPNPNLTTVI